MSIVIGLCALVGGYLIYRLVKMSLETGKKDGLVMAGLIGLVFALGSMTVLGGTQRATERYEAERVQQEAARIQEEGRERQAEYDQLNADRREAERREREEKYAAREKELAEVRMTADEFNARFLEMLNTERMSTPTERTSKGGIETVTYPFDHDGEMFLTEVTSFGGLKRVTVDVRKIDGGNLDVAWFIYATAVQILAPEDDFNYIFTQLRLYPADVAVADLKNPRSVQVGDYVFKKSVGSSSISFSVVDTR